MAWNQRVIGMLGAYDFDLLKNWIEKAIGLKIAAAQFI
jgi:hypothetical protein